MTTMNNNETTQVYPEQQNPPRPTYEAELRGIKIGGWLYYTETSINIVVSVDGNRITAMDYPFTDDDTRKRARHKAKNVWRSVVLAILGGV